MTCHAFAPWFAGSGSGARFCKAERIDAAAGTPRPIRILKVCPAGLLAHRSIASCCAFPRAALSVTPLFLLSRNGEGKSHISLAVYSCGGSCGLSDHLRSFHRIPFSSRFHANRCTTRCCVPRRDFVNSLCTRNIVKKVLKWTGFVVAGLALLGYAWIYFASERELGREFTPAQDVSLVIPTDAAEIAEGQRIAQLAGCMHCHGDNLAGAV